MSRTDVRSLKDRINKYTYTVKDDGSLYLVVTKCIEDEYHRCRASSDSSYEEYLKYSSSELRKKIDGSFQRLYKIHSEEEPSLCDESVYPLYDYYYGDGRVTLKNNKKYLSMLLYFLSNVEIRVISKLMDKEI